MAKKTEIKTEEKVKELIKESLNKRLKGFKKIDTELKNSEFIERWLIEIMLLGKYDLDIEAATKEIFKSQKSLKNKNVLEEYLEDYRARMFLSYNRFVDEIYAFKKYLELKDKETEKVILYAVEKELENVEEGSFLLSNIS